MISVSFTTPGKLNWLWEVVGFGGFELPELADAGLQSPGDLWQCGPATGVDGLRLHSTNNSMGDWVKVWRGVSRMYGQRVPHLRKLHSEKFYPCLICARNERYAVPFHRSDRFGQEGL